jgi:hypothetical protein
MKHATFLLLAGLFGVVSAFETRASVFACLLLVIALASLSRFEHKNRRHFVWLLGVSLLFTTVGLVRFVFGEALTGISEARGRATGKKAVSLLREILFAQDAVRRYGMIDHDGDGIGSAARLGELSGTDGARMKNRLSTPPLALRYTPRVATRSGPASEQEGYLLLICLPGILPNSWVTHPSEEVAEELAERRWVAYAWPVAEGLGHEAAYFINEHEEILESENLQDGKLRLVGSQTSPSCDDAILPETIAFWRPWSGKKRREILPGDK